MIDEHRTDELAAVLQELSAKIVQYARKADSPEGTVGTLQTPAEMGGTLDIHVGDKGEGIKGLMRSADLLLDTSVVTWHKTFLEKLYAGTNPVGVGSDLLLSILNTNSHVFTASPALTYIEKYVARKYAGMFGFTGPHAGGLTFPGGSYSNITAMHMARSLLHPETKKQGNSTGLVAFTSAHSHYSIEKAAILLGLGADAVVKVRVHEDGRMDVDELAKRVREAKVQGKTPFLINGTAGSTVYGSFDNLERIADVAKTHNIWFHIDGSWGGNVIFSDKEKYKMEGSVRADSITVNPHKMLGVPCTCSFLLVPDEAKFQQANSLQASYLFHENHDEGEFFDLADGTMGCGRRADALKLYLGWQWYGTQGYAERIDHAFEMTAYLAHKVHDTPGFVLLSTLPPPCLQTCFFYTPTGKLGSKEENTNLTRSVARKLLARSKFLIDYSPHPEHGEFFRVVLNAPAVDKPMLDRLVDDIKTIGDETARAESADNR